MFSWFSSTYHRRTYIAAYVFVNSQTDFQKYCVCSGRIDCNTKLGQRDIQVQTIYFYLRRWCKFFATPWACFELDYICLGKLENIFSGIKCWACVFLLIQFHDMLCAIMHDIGMVHIQRMILSITYSTSFVLRTPSRIEPLI